MPRHIDTSGSLPTSCKAVWPKTLVTSSVSCQNVVQEAQENGSSKLEEAVKEAKQLSQEKAEVSQQRDSLQKEVSTLSSTLSNLREEVQALDKAKKQPEAAPQPEEAKPKAAVSSPHGLVTCCLLALLSSGKHRCTLTQVVSQCSQSKNKEMHCFCWQRFGENSKQCLVMSTQSCM